MAIIVQLASVAALFLWVDKKRSSILIGSCWLFLSCIIDKNLFPFIACDCIISMQSIGKDVLPSRSSCGRGQIQSYFVVAIDGVSLLLSWGLLYIEWSNFSQEIPCMLFLQFDSEVLWVCDAIHAAWIEVCHKFLEGVLCCNFTVAIKAPHLVFGDWWGDAFH